MIKPIQRFTLRIASEFALFTRPECKVERLSYDVITPSAARGVFDAVYWKPEIIWRIDRIHVMRPIRFTNMRRNEVRSKIPAGAVAKAMKAGRGRLGLYADDGDNRQQRAAMLLRDVEYLVEAHFEIVGGEANPAKHSEMFRRRAEQGQCFHRPYLGCREFAADFELVQGELPISPLVASGEGDRDLGLMLHDIDYADGMRPRFFHAVMQSGKIDVPVWETHV